MYPLHPQLPLLRRRERMVGTDSDRQNTEMVGQARDPLRRPCVTAARRPEPTPPAAAPGQHAATPRHLRPRGTRDSAHYRHDT